MKSKAKRLVIAGLMLAVAILLPQAVHLSGNAALGQLLLPMHLPVLLGGLLLGPAYGLLLGILSPLCSMLLTGMPAAARLPFMLVELAAYGFAAGLLYRKTSLGRIKGGLNMALVLAMLLGRGAYVLAAFIAGELLHIPGVGVAAALNAITAGLYGIIIQLALLPTITLALERIFHEAPRTSKKSAG